tara:strand:+ start:62 stop:445 length:384 start_codon:yes stop_codon:yes gene_type:complete
MRKTTANRSDELGISEINTLGIDQIILSTEINPVISECAKKLNIICLQGIENKKETLTKFCNENNYDWRNVGFVGNDINDKEAMIIAGIKFYLADSQKSIKDIADYVLRTKGGDGVIRELYDIIKGD